MSDWVVLRANVNELDGERRDWALGLVTRLGLDPADLRPELCVSTGPDGLRLRLSRYQRDESGQKVPDHNLNVMATTPVVVAIDVSDLPAELQSAAVGA